MYMADSADQRQLKTQKWALFPCELKHQHTRLIETTQGLHEQKHTPHYAKNAFYAFLARFEV